VAAPEADEFGPSGKSSAAESMEGRSEMSATKDDASISGRISSDAVREATGRGWEKWFQALDEAGAEGWSHGQIVAYLRAEHADATTGWWRQSITVAYEQARGKRAVGETSSGFQVGVQGSVAADAARVWALITSRPELWLGEGAAVRFVEAERYEVRDDAGGRDTSGEIRVVKPADRLRLTWQPEGWPSAATLQLSLSESRSGKTVIRVDLEKLPDGDARETTRTRWREALEQIDAALRQ
jgi:uncharacterized protein YndB with AHSA1/START domain